MYQQQQQVGSGPGPVPETLMAEAAAQNYDLTGNTHSSAGAMNNYPVSKLAELLHSVPRFDLNLRPVRSTFQPDQTAYKESLLVWSAVPFDWLLLTLLLFLVYFCCRCCCCQRDSEKKRPKVRCCLRCTTAVFAGLACCAILVGFYGNEEAHKGLEQAVEGSSGVIETIASIQSEIPSLNSSVYDVVGEYVEKMKDVYRQHPELHRDLQTQLYTSITVVYESAVKMLESLGDISRYMLRVNVNSLDHYLSTAQKFFNYRRLVTLIFFGLLALFCLMLLIGICNSSKCTLILFCAMGIFCLVFCYLSQGLHIGLSLLIGDFCVNPHTLLHSASTDPSESEVINYYIGCDNVFMPNPFKKSLQSASDHLKTANSSLTKAINTTSKFILKSEYGQIAEELYISFDFIHDTLIQLTANVECNALNKNYRRSLDGICHKTLLGVVLLTSALGISGLLFSVLVVLSSLTWGYFGRNCSRGAQVRMRADLMPMQRRTTPPPAYNSSEFYRQYGDVNSSD